MDADHPPSPAPAPFLRPLSSSSSLLRDVSNFKTPKRPLQTSNYNTPCTEKFFTASKRTPRSSYSCSNPSSLRRGPALVRSKSKTKTAAARRLKSLELEQSQSAYKTHLRKEQSLKTLSKSLTVWLNFLLQNPKSCGCSSNGADFLRNVGPTGKREGGEVVTWRSPKRQRDMWWRGGGSEIIESEEKFSDSKYLALRNSLKDMCSFDDLKQRMRFYLSLGCCKEIFDIMSHVTKNIDEGRLRMKSHCPIVTDVGMKERAIRVLMCYNPVWLRIGLYIVFGGESLLLNEDSNSDQEVSFLKMMIEKQFFVHAGLAKAYAYNRKVEGLYKPGYYEILGNIILKRLLLLVLVLDRAKMRSALPVEYGIDGVDGGSPLLFSMQSSIKSSSQVIVDFLSSDVMHGEGNLITHLVIVGYKVSYKQSPLVEYDFKVTDLFVDLQDGVRLCRIIQLLLQDSSILMKMVVPSDTRKKNLMNCGIALQYLSQAGLKLYDQDGTAIMEDDVANGDKELVISLLWNMFVHLQLPLLINKTALEEEICKIRKSRKLEQLNNVNPTSLDLLLNWIQEICKKYDCCIGDFSSLVDGKAIWCLLDYYFRKDLCCSCSSEDDTRREESIMSATDYNDAFHNFILSQKLTKLLGNFPEVLQMSDILEHNGSCSYQSVVILLVFLTSQLIVKKNMDQLNFHKLLDCNCKSPERRHSNMHRCLVNSGGLAVQEEKDHSTEGAVRKFKALQAWWQEMAEKNYKHDLKAPIATVQSFSTSKGSTNFERAISALMPPENAAKVIQSHFRSLNARRNFLKMRNAVLHLQIVFRAWLALKENSALNNLEISRGKQKQSEIFRSCIQFFVERHGFVKLKRSALIIQKATRLWITRKNQVGSIASASSTELLNGAADGQKIDYSIAEFGIMCQTKVKTDLETEAAVLIQFAWLNFKSRKSLRKRCFAATKIQSHFRGWLLRRTFLHQKGAAIQIQSHFRCLRCWSVFQQYKTATKSAIVIQSYVRHWIAWRRSRRLKYLVVVLQKHFRGWLTRRDFSFQREAAIKIQSAVRCTTYRTAFRFHKHAATEIQRFARGQIARSRLLGASCYRAAMTSSSNLNTTRGSIRCFELEIIMSSVVKLQRWWRHVLLLKLRTKSAIILQSHIRGWIARQKVTRKKHCVDLIQSYWKCYLARKEASQQLIDLRLGVQKSAMNAVKLQRWWRHVLLRKSRTKSAIIIQSNIRGWIARQNVCRKKKCIVLIQSYWKGYLARKEASQQLLDLRLGVQKSATNAVKLQRWWRHVLLCKLRTKSAIIIQSHVRGWIARQNICRKKHCIVLIQKEASQRLLDLHLGVQKSVTNAVKLQRWWRYVLHKIRAKSAIIIQSHVRGWIARQYVSRQKHSITLIQSYWKGYIARKQSSQQLLDLRLRVQKSATNIDDSRRIINRLLFALSELLSMKSVTGILHTCATLDMATEHSQKCCEKLVAAGAIGTLLKLIRSVSRSIPDQEVLKHALSTLRNLARYPHLIEVLIDTQGSVETIFLEMLRNKEDGYYIASHILKRICSNHKGIEATCKLPAHLKRLKSLVEELTRKASLEKRNTRNWAVRENTERRLREATELLRLITHG